MKTKTEWLKDPIYAIFWKTEGLRHYGTSASKKNQRKSKIRNISKVSGVTYISGVVFDKNVDKVFILQLTVDCRLIKF